MIALTHEEYLKRTGAQNVRDRERFTGVRVDAVVFDIRSGLPVDLTGPEPRRVGPAAFMLHGISFPVEEIDASELRLNMVAMLARAFQVPAFPRDERVGLGR